MTTPLLYIDLTPAEKAWMCNGCGPKLGKFPDVVPDFIFHEACCTHDFDYWSGFTDHDRAIADRRFLGAMLEEARQLPTWWRRKWYSFLAWRYYSFVRLFGARSFSYRKRYATREDLEAEMKA